MRGTGTSRTHKQAPAGVRKGSSQCAKEERTALKGGDNGGTEKDRPATLVRRDGPTKEGERSSIIGVVCAGIKQHLHRQAFQNDTLYNFKF